MANNDRLMALVSMLSGTLQNVGAQRGQRSQARAGMQMDRARMEMQRENEMQRRKEALEDRKIQLGYLNQRIKELKATQEINKMAAQEKAEMAEWGAVSQPTKETSAEFTKRGAEQITEGVGDKTGVLSSLAAIAKNLPAAAQIAGKGPETKPGMTYPEFYAQETAEGVAPEALFGVAGLQQNLTPFEQEMQKLQMQFLKGQITGQQLGAKLTELEIPLAEYRAAHPEFMEPGYGYPRGGYGGGVGGGTLPLPETTALTPEQQYQQDADVLARAGELGAEDLAAQVDAIIEYYKGNFAAGNASKEEIIALAASYGWTFDPADYSVAEIFDGLREHLMEKFRYKKPKEGGEVSTLKKVEAPPGTAFRGKSGREV